MHFEGVSGLSMSFASFPLKQSPVHSAVLTLTLLESTSSSHPWYHYGIILKYNEHLQTLDPTCETTSTAPPIVDRTLTESSLKDLRRSCRIRMDRRSIKGHKSEATLDLEWI